MHNRIHTYMYTHQDDWKAMRDAAMKEQEESEVKDEDTVTGSPQAGSTAIGEVKVCVRM